MDIRISELSSTDADGASRCCCTISNNFARSAALVLASEEGRCIAGVGVAHTLAVAAGMASSSRFSELLDGIRPVITIAALQVPFPSLDLVSSGGG